MLTEGLKGRLDALYVRLRGVGGLILFPIYKDRQGGLIVSESNIADMPVVCRNAAFCRVEHGGHNL
jgi:hypothetical protein